MKVYLSYLNRQPQYSLVFHLNSIHQPNSVSSTCCGKEMKIMIGSLHLLVKKDMHYITVWVLSALHCSAVILGHFYIF